MGSLFATGIADPVYKDQFGLDKPEYSIWISDTNGYARNIHFSKPFNDEGDRYVVSEIFDGVFTVKKYLFESIFIKPFEKKK